MGNLPPKKNQSSDERIWTFPDFENENWSKQDDVKDAMTYQILGREMSLPEMAESAIAMLRDDMAAESDPTACEHNVVLPYQGGYACGTCHEQVELQEARDVWVNLDNGVVKITGIRCYSGLEDMFEDED